MRRTHTYYAGKRIELGIRDDEFVVRAPDDVLRKAGLPEGERVSSGAVHIKTHPALLETMMARARVEAPTHHVYEMESGEPFLVTDRVIVKFKRAMEPGDVAAFAGEYGLVIVDQMSPDEAVFQLTTSTGINPIKLVAQLNESNDQRLEYAENDRNHRVQKRVAIPTDAAYLRQWYLHQRSTLSAFDPRSSVRCEDAWQLLGSFGSADVVVGITDDGCNLEHRDFDTNAKFAGWGYFSGTTLLTNSDMSADPSRMYIEGDEHGTACAGVVGAEVDGETAVGAAPGCRLLPVKWESQGPYLLISDYKLRKAIDYLADKVDVISNSWGSTPTQIFSSTITDRIEQLEQTGGRRNRGILFLWAAGNENCPLRYNGSVAVPYTHGWEVTASNEPKWVGVQTSKVFEHNLIGLSNVLLVGALSSKGQRSHYSNYGTGLSLCAPSSNSHAYYRMTVVGLGITTTEGSGLTNTFGGTSSATPLVAGIAALIISADSKLTAPEVAELLKRTAAKNLDESAYAKTSATTYDPNTAWDVSPVAPFDSGGFVGSGAPDGSWSPWFGHGCVHAAAAVQAAKGTQASGWSSFSSAPERAIPDNNAAGTEVMLAVPKSGRIKELRVSLDIAHTWIGDLRVSLRSPDNRMVVLHDRGGGNAKNLVKTYDLASLPALSSFVGIEARGDWKLLLQDLAARDEGILRDWELQLQLQEANIVAEEQPGVSIPDADSRGVSRALAIDESRPIRNISVAVDITHPYIGDLIVELVSPSGASVRLHDRSGRDGDNIIRTYSDADSAGLRALVASSCKGEWRLKIADVAAQDRGKLNRWRIEIA